jgi:hypothetical protein
MFKFYPVFSGFLFAGAIWPCLEFLSSSMDQQILKDAAMAVASLACHEGSQAELVQQGVVTPLIALLCSSTDASLQVMFESSSPNVDKL